MQLGISQLIVPKLSLEEFFAQAKQWGYDVVELGVSASGTLPYDAGADQVERIRALSQEHGLPIVSLVCSHADGNLLESADADAGRRGIEETRRSLALAGQLGARCILDTLGRLSPELYYDQAWDNAIANLRTLTPHATDADVRIAIEFIWNGFLFSPLEMRRLIEAVGGDRVGFYFDPGNMAVFHHPQHWVRILARHIVQVHLKDWRGGPLDGQWTALLDGELDFEVIMAELRDAGYDGPLVSEVTPNLAAPDRTAQAMRRIAALAT